MRELAKCSWVGMMTGRASSSGRDRHDGKLLSQEELGGAQYRKEEGKSDCEGSHIWSDESERQ